MKRIPLITITPTIKVQILCSLASWKALLISYLHKKIQKINIHHHLIPSCPKQQWQKFGHFSLLGAKGQQSKNNALQNTYMATLFVSFSAKS
jgi:hypothetical protein